MSGAGGVDFPPPVCRGVEAALAEGECRDAVSIAAARTLGGGCVSPAAALTLTDGRRFFLKWGDGHSPVGLFREEARSLRALAATGAVRVPAVAAVAEDWLLLEWLPPGVPTHAAWAELGRRLAALHRTTADRFGWDADNFIGPLPQGNGWTSEWPDFWRDRRLAPQLERALGSGLLGAGDARAFERLFVGWHDLLAAAGRDGASLLHGDLWNGNVLMLENGGVALVDPSASYGHREVDLAMAALFGGFDEAFHSAYAEAWPPEPGHEVRRHVYQLYYLLVHVNLFGAGYVAGTRSALDRALAGV